ncbi:pyridoxamine 5'-phosphate oxidase family protein [Pseudonocardia pini]|uniref:pyridoxamine 5'-phosphate oxidase family protein n=1 Tax=Pseudonocardia pini TaxID=2758030 RepID=UPI0015F123CD|nr:pyridoxamine 5'-phosphate oxidase family protein [Pseudonocardia pini]
MASWKEVEEQAPALAARARRLLDAHKHKTIATLRADGSPRISGIEAQVEEGELVFGSMPGARKGADLLRDPRFALHSAAYDPPEDAPADWAGDAKIAGRAVSTGPLDGPVDGDSFRADVTEVVVTALNAAADRLVVEFWREGVGVRRVERE